MVLFFSEEDMKDFGNFILSERREYFYRNHPEYKNLDDEELNEVLKQVNSEDFSCFLYELNKNKNYESEDNE